MGAKYFQTQVAKKMHGQYSKMKNKQQGASQKL